MYPTCTVHVVPRIKPQPVAQQWEVSIIITATPLLPLYAWHSGTRQIVYILYQCQCSRYTGLMRSNRQKQLSTISRCTGTLFLVINGLTHITTHNGSLFTIYTCLYVLLSLPTWPRANTCLQCT
jgi:hypothetical protein